MPPGRRYGAVEEKNERREPRGGNRPTSPLCIRDSFLLLDIVTRYGNVNEEKSTTPARRSGRKGKKNTAGYHRRPRRTLSAICVIGRCRSEEKIIGGMRNGTLRKFEESQ